MEETQLDVSNSESDGESHEKYTEVKPWIRFWARILDYIVFVSIAFFLAETLFKMQLKSNSYLFYFLAVFIWTFIEAALLSTWGTTPGKWLFNVTIRDAEGKKPGFVPALKRSIYVWFFGVGMGIPIIFLFELVAQYNNLTKMKATSWDHKMKFIVHHDYLRVVKTTIIVFIYAGFVIVQMIIPQMKWGAEYSKNMMKQYGLTDSASSINSIGYSFMNSGEYGKAKEQFLKGLDANPDIETKDTLFNNLSWACYSLGEYDEALKYSKEGLAINKNDSIEYSNYANALYALGNTSEAEKAYQKAVELDKINSYAYYGLGQLKYDNYKYEEAIEAFGKYTGLKKDDSDGWCYLGLSYLNGNKNMLKAKECLDKAMEVSPKDIFVINSMADYYNYAGDSKKTEELYKNALDENQNDYDLLCDVAEFYQNDEKYDEAIKYADRAINANGTGYEAYRIKARTFFWQGEKQKAIDTINLMVGKNPQNADVYKVAGDLYNNEYEYRLAVEIYEKALEINPLYENAIIGKIRALYNSKRYTACQQFALEAENKIDNYEIPWYIGDVYSRLRDSAKALEYYKKALVKDEKDAALLTSIGWEYYYSEDFANAGLYAGKALQVDGSNSNAKDLKKSIEKRQTGVIDQVTDFIEKNYMYYKSSTGYDALKNSLKTNQSAGIEDINRLFDAVHKENDMFSFVLYGENYKRFLEYQSGKTVEHETVNENTDYIRITNFSSSTANEFLDIVDNIENTKDKYLIIDLRGNGGGDTNSGCDILDFLLPDSVVCNLIYKDGYSNPYYSDEEHIPFKHIFVLVDEKSASCAELVTLGLKTYLDNVTVVGRKTFGKGVGQTLFEDKTRGFVIFLVNHYWNVREENIMGKGIQPDKQVRGNSLESYMNEVYKLIKNMQ